MSMEVRKTGLEGVQLIVPKVYEDSRGYFMELFQSQRYEEAGQDHGPLQPRPRSA